MENAENENYLVTDLAVESENATQLRETVSGQLVDSVADQVESEASVEPSTRQGIWSIPEGKEKYGDDYNIQIDEEYIIGESRSVDR